MPDKNLHGMREWNSHEPSCACRTRPQDGIGFRIGEGLGVEGEFEISGFPRIRAAILGAPILRTMVFGGLKSGSPIGGSYHIEVHYYAKLIFYSF